jgi:hypothetical protein
MNFHWPFTRPEPRHTARYVVATKAESAAVRRKRTQLELALGVYVAQTTPEQRKNEADAYFAVARELARDEQMRGRS